MSRLYGFVKKSAETSFFHEINYIIPYYFKKNGREFSVSCSREVQKTGVRGEGI